METLITFCRYVNNYFEINTGFKKPGNKSRCPSRGTPESRIQSSMKEKWQMEGSNLPLSFPCWLCLIEKELSMFTVISKKKRRCIRSG